MLFLKKKFEFIFRNISSRTFRSPSTKIKKIRQHSGTLHHFVIAQLSSVWGIPRLLVPWFHVVSKVRCQLASGAISTRKRKTQTDAPHWGPDPLWEPKPYQRGKNNLLFY